MLFAFPSPHCPFRIEADLARTPAESISRTSSRWRHALSGYTKHSMHDAARQRQHNFLLGFWTRILDLTAPGTSDTTAAWEGGWSGMVIQELASRKRVISNSDPCRTTAC